MVELCPARYLHPVISPGERSDNDQFAWLSLFAAQVGGSEHGRGGNGGRRFGFHLSQLAFPREHRQAHGRRQQKDASL